VRCSPERRAEEQNETPYHVKTEKRQVIPRVYGPLKIKGSAEKEEYFSEILKKNNSVLHKIKQKKWTMQIDGSMHEMSKQKGLQWQNRKA
jgi:hypothetical protein